MYHVRFKGRHYEAGFKWGKMLYTHGKVVNDSPTFDLTEERKTFAIRCASEYESYYPEIFEEISGIADGQKVSFNTLAMILFSMYCFEIKNKCTCFAFTDGDNIIFGRNSDFLKKLEKLNMNCLYRLDNVYAFNGNTTAFVQMEDGVNEQGFAAGLTFVYPHIRKPGLNAGMLIRYLLEKCKTTEEALIELHRLPIASAQTITLADRKSDIAVVECNSEKIIVIRPKENENFVAATNNFNSNEMKLFRNPGIDDWYSDKRYNTVCNALKGNKGKYSLNFAEDILTGKYGFTCQYDRKLGADTIWSVVYDLNNNRVYRAEGNPLRRAFKEDKRMKFMP